MNIFFGILIGLFSLIFLVTAHEFGHFIMARKNGVKVLEFGICFPPRAVAWVHRKKYDKDGNPLKKDGKYIYKWEKIPKKDWKKEQDGLIFSLNWLPIGGFCQMDGESDDDKRSGTFGASSYWSKTKILFGGVAINWLIGIIIFTILAWTGMPIFLDNQFTIENDENINFSPVLVTKVVPNSPAERAGFLENDQILSVNGKEVYTAYDEAFSSFAGETIDYKILRTTESGEEEKILTTTLNEKDNEWGYLLGVSMQSDQVYKSYTWSAPLIGIGTTAQLTGETFKGVGTMLWNLISGTARQFSFNGASREAGKTAIKEAGDSVTGPIGIIGIIFPSVAESGFSNVAFIVAMISVSLACMNVLPIPALDGGRWLMITIARLKHTRLSKEKEEKIVARAMLVLLALMLLITILDITRFF